LRLQINILKNLNQIFYYYCLIRRIYLCPKEIQHNLYKYYRYIHTGFSNQLNNYCNVSTTHSRRFPADSINAHHRFRPERSGLPEDVDDWPGSTDDFLRLGFPKYIHFSSPVTIRWRNDFIFCLARKISHGFWRRSIHAALIFRTIEPFPWHIGEWKCLVN